jgi:hypothetical protein
MDARDREARERGAVSPMWTPAQGEHYRLEMHRHAEALGDLWAALDLDALERRAVEAITRTYGPVVTEDAAFWAQKGIEGMRFAVAEAKERASLAVAPCGGAFPLGGTCAKPAGHEGLCAREEDL